MHLNFFHMIFNLVAVTPLLERFESEFGTLVTLALFTGRKQAMREEKGIMELTGVQRSVRYQEVYTHCSKCMFCEATP